MRWNTFFRCLPAALGAQIKAAALMPLSVPCAGRCTVRGHAVQQHCGWTRLCSPAAMTFSVTSLMCPCVQGREGFVAVAPPSWQGQGLDLPAYSKAESFPLTFFSFSLSPAAVPQLPQHVPVPVVSDLQWPAQTCEFA